MGRIVVIEKNEAGKVELSKEELQQMLDDAYNQGFADGNRATTITVPSYPVTYNPYVTDTKPIITCTCKN